MAFLSKNIWKRWTKIHGFGVFVENMVKIAPELVSSPPKLKGGIKVEPYA
jgi:hypothetical protein